ncbi:hypothetical protein ACHAPJ_007708 [Fusarium lateritium]
MRSGHLKMRSTMRTKMQSFRRLTTARRVLGPNDDDVEEESEDEAWDPMVVAPEDRLHLTATRIASTDDWQKHDNTEESSTVTMMRHNDREEALTRAKEGTDVHIPSEGSNASGGEDQGLPVARIVEEYKVQLREDRRKVSWHWSCKSHGSIMTKQIMFHPTSVDKSQLA